MAAATDYTQTEAYQDYVAVVLGGQTKADRAREKDRKAATINANIRTAEKHFADGTWERPTSAEGVTVSKTVDRRSIIEGMVPGAAMFLDALDKAESERTRLQNRITEMQEQFSNIDDRVKNVRAMFENLGGNWDEFDAAVAAAETEAQSGGEQKEESDSEAKSS